MQVLLGSQQPGQPVVHGQLRHEAADQVRRALVQGALRAAVGGPLDPAVRRIGGPRVDPRELQRPGIGPGAVPVAVRQVGRPAAGDLIQRLPVRRAAGEPLHSPARAGDPVPFRVLAAVGGDPGQRVVQARGPDQVAADHRHPGEGGMHVRVLEAGQQRAAVQVDHLGGRTGQVLDAGVASLADRRDPAADDCNRACGTAIRRRGRHHPAAARVGGVDRPAREHQLGLLHAYPPFRCV